MTLRSGLLVSEHPDGVGSKGVLECVLSIIVDGQKPFPGVYVNKCSSVMASAKLMSFHRAALE